MASTRSRPPAADQDPVLFCLDTATAYCCLALLRGPRTVFSLAFTPPGGHSAHLMQAVDAMEKLSGVPRGEWSAVAVSRGPGSFTGLRIGLATAKALSLGLGIPLYGVPTLEALAARTAATGADPVCPLLDARKGQVFAALYRRARSGGLREVLPPAAVEPARLPELIPGEATFTGDGADRYLDVLRASYGRGLRLAPPPLRRPDAAETGLLALPRLARGEPSELSTLVPLYVRASDAELTYGPPESPRRPR